MNVAIFIRVIKYVRMNVYKWRYPCFSHCLCVQAGLAISDNYRDFFLHAHLLSVLYDLLTAFLEMPNTKILAKGFSLKARSSTLAKLVRRGLHGVYRGIVHNVMGRGYG
jgi:hypothetical protein